MTYKEKIKWVDEDIKHIIKIKQENGNFYSSSNWNIQYQSDLLRNLRFSRKMFQIMDKISRLKKKSELPYFFKGKVK